MDSPLEKNTYLLCCAYVKRKKYRKKFVSLQIANLDIDLMIKILFDIFTLFNSFWNIYGLPLLVYSAAFFSQKGELNYF